MHCNVMPYQIESVRSRRAKDLAIGHGLPYFGLRHSRKMVGLGGLEPPASPLSGVRSNHLSYRPGCFLVELIGIEPTTPCLQSRCSPS